MSAETLPSAGSVNPFSADSPISGKIVDQIDRPDQASGSNLLSRDGSEDELDFSKEPIFAQDDGFKRFPIPGLQNSYISVRNSVDYAVEGGRSKFVIQERQITDKRQMSDNIRQITDVVGHSYYLIEHCVCDFRIQDPKTNQVKEWNGNPKHAVTCFKSIRSSKLINWATDKITSHLGWSEEEEENTARFSEES